MRFCAPFPWFGGKSMIAPKVWERFGEPEAYAEPFAGSAAMLLARPGWTPSPSCLAAKTPSLFGDAL